MSDNTIKVTSIIAVTVIVLALIGFYSFQSLFNIGGNTIKTEGYSSIKVNPDVVSIYFNVETDGTTTKEANDANSKIVNDFTLSLLAIGIERKDIQTMGLNVYEDQYWDGRKYVSKGFKASHQMRIVLNTSETGLIADVVDSGVNAGAMLSYINFELSTTKQNEYKAQALREAGLDAQNKAKAIAEGLGKRLGSLVSVSTSDFSYQPWNLYSARADASAGANAEEAKLAATNIQPGTQEVTANIQVVYKIR